jgi:pimeloyl-ACP methyl ester carboxylesterase
MLSRLEERFDVLAVDLPAFGHSEPFPPEVDSTPEALADTVRASSSAIQPPSELPAMWARTG